MLYDFYRIDQGEFQLSFGVGLSWLLNDFDRKEVLLGCIYPSFRYYLTGSEFFTTYVFATTGFSYMTDPSFGHQILGAIFPSTILSGQEPMWGANGSGV